VGSATLEVERDRLGQRELLFLEDSAAERVFVIAGKDGYATLHENGALVVFVRDVVHGAATLTIARGEYGAMNPLAVEALAPVARQQRGMDVEYATRPALGHEQET
jgi:hypothetical protein